MSKTAKHAWDAYNYKDWFRQTEELNNTTNFGSMMQFEVGISIAKADPFLNLRKSVAGDAQSEKVSLVSPLQQALFNAHKIEHSPTKQPKVKYLKAETSKKKDPKRAKVLYPH